MSLLSVLQQNNSEVDTDYQKTNEQLLSRVQYVDLFKNKDLNIKGHLDLLLMKKGIAYSDNFIFDTKQLLEALSGCQFDEINAWFIQSGYEAMEKEVADIALNNGENIDFSKISDLCDELFIEEGGKYKDIETGLRSLYNFVLNEKLSLLKIMDEPIVNGNVQKATSSPKSIPIQSFTPNAAPATNANAAQTQPAQQQPPQQVKNQANQVQQPQNQQTKISAQEINQLSEEQLLQKSVEELEQYK